MIASKKTFIALFFMLLPSLFFAGSFVFGYSDRITPDMLITYGCLMPFCAFTLIALDLLNRPKKPDIRFLSISEKEKIISLINAGSEGAEKILILELGRLERLVTNLNYRTEVFEFDIEPAFKEKDNEKEI